MAGLVARGYEKGSQRDGQNIHVDCDGPGVAVAPSLNPVQNYKSSYDPPIDNSSLLSTICTDKPKRERNFTNYADRLETFFIGPQCWPRVQPTAVQLASLGFYYTGYETRVVCHCCQVIINSWDDGQSPLLKHYKQSISCAFIDNNFLSELKVLLSQSSLVVHINSHYASSSSRLHSFLHWPATIPVTSFQLASVGFYYTGIGTNVQCFSCGFSYENWQPGDVPLLIHKTYSPLCAFLKTLSPESSLSLPLPQTSSLSPFSTQTPVYYSSNDVDKSKPPDYSNEHIRMQSFKHLPNNIPISGHKCALAGLYFLRKPDVMKCFSCRCVLRGWIEGDIPVEKHREVNPHCKFITEFFPTKLDKPLDEYTVDPSTLPEPHYDEHQLEQMASPCTGTAPELRYVAKSNDQLCPFSAHLSQLSLEDHQPHKQSSTSKRHKILLGVSTSLPQFPACIQSQQQECSTSLPVSTAQQQREYAASLPTEQQSIATSLDSEDKSLCVICMDSPLEMVLVPCGHLCVCEVCSKLITYCPMCRQPSDTALRVFFP